MTELEEQLREQRAAHAGEVQRLRERLAAELEQVQGRFSQVGGSALRRTAPLHVFPSLLLSRVCGAAPPARLAEPKSCVTRAQVVEHKDALIAGLRQQLAAATAQLQQMEQLLAA